MNQGRVLIERLDQLIRMKGTGTARDLADRLNVSHTTVYEILECMKSMGAEIEYCRERRSFYYLEDKTLAIGFVNKRQIRGGQQFFSKNFSLSRYALQTQNTFDPKPEVQAAD